MRFRVIRFDEFSEHDFCYLQLCGWLQGVIFSSVEIALREAFGIILNRFDGFLDHGIFYPQLWGWLHWVVLINSP